MSTQTHTTFQIHGISSGVLDTARSTRLDALSNPVVHLVASGGEPLRCCLRDAVEGEELMLFGYEPVLPAGPYREIGPVFAHLRDCPGSLDIDTYPPAWRGRPQALRAYDDRGWIYDAKVHDGQQPEAIIDDLLADPNVVQIHSRNIAYGCYMFAITRVGQDKHKENNDGHEI